MTTENTLPFDYFLSSQMEKIRDDMFEGKKIDGCEGCYKDEEINGHSHRTKFNEESNYNAADVTKVSTKLNN